MKELGIDLSDQTPKERARDQLRQRVVQFVGEHQ